MPIGEMGPDLDGLLHKAFFKVLITWYQDKKTNHKIIGYGHKPISGSYGHSRITVEPPDWP